jgi:hypothetical protein
MTDPIKNKLDEFINRIENEEGDEATNETMAYLHGCADNEENPKEQEILRIKIRNLEMVISINKVTKHFKKENENTKSQLNKALRKIIKLEKRVNKLEIGNNIKE